MNKVERIQKGLDHKGLVSAWNELAEHTDYIRGLILTEARHDCEAKKENWVDYIKAFSINGTTIDKSYANRLIKASAEKAELRILSEKRGDIASGKLQETEAELTLPDSASTQMELRGENAIQKARNYQDVKETTGKEQPSAGDIRAYNNAAKEAKEKIEEFKKKAKVPKTDKVDPFTTEEEIDFETWCLKNYNFDVLKEKPKFTRAIYALKDERVSALFDDLKGWKKAYKEMAKLCHPDTGGSNEAMRYLSEFNELMLALTKIEKIIEYEHKIEKYKKEYSEPKKIEA